MKYVNQISLALLLFLTACAAPWRINLMHGVHDAELIKEVKPAPEYRIQVGDELSFRLRTLSRDNAGPIAQLLGEYPSDSQMSGSQGASGLSEYAVDDAGQIDIPYLGKIKVVGLTIYEAKQLLEQKLYEQVKQCSVEVSLINNYFIAMGEFGSGRIPLPKDQTNIYEALALTGKISDVGDRARVKLVRQTPDGSIVKTFDLRSKEIISSEFFWIQPNDIIYIQPRNGQFFGIHTTLYSGIGILTAVISIVTLAIKLTD